jgi:hypothetical protein
MPLLGRAAVAMWWHVEPEHRSEFGDWHAHEHFPERMSIPGFRRGSRWSSVGDAGDVFVLYELDAYDVLTSSAYVRRLNAPTPWSTKMMPRHLGMIRSQCRIDISRGGGVAAAMATIRLSPVEGRTDELRRGLVESLVRFANKPGLTGAHLLVTDTPTTLTATTEQKIRGADQTADWIILLSGYDPEAVRITLKSELSPAALQAMGARDDPTTGVFRLALAMTPADLSSMSGARTQP